MIAIESEIRAARRRELESYLQGALRDGTASPQHGTHRFGQANHAWLEVLREILSMLGHRSWIYREGRTRRFWILETSADFLDPCFDPSPLSGSLAARAFVRGYFDADGGMPRQGNARFYVQFTQKDREDLSRLRALLESDGIRCGALHNPSRRVDPDYWRFFVGASGHRRYLELIGSWHPAKRQIVLDRLRSHDHDRQAG